MNLIDNYLDAEAALYKYFGYEQGNHIRPFMDERERYWAVSKSLCTWGTVSFGPTAASARQSYRFVTPEDENWPDYYSYQGIFKGEDFTLIEIDVQAYGSFFLGIYDNSKEQEWETC